MRSPALLILCLFGLGSLPVPAQQVLAPPPQPIEVPVPPPPLAGETNVVESTPQEPGPAVSVPARNPLQWGRVTMRPHVSYRFSYGDGIQSSPGNPRTTALNELSPGVMFQLGSRWVLDYTPRIMLYSNKEFKDTVNQSVNLSGGTTYQDWGLNFSQGYSSTSDPLVETGQQTDQETFSTAFGAVYSMGSKMALDLNLTQSIRLAPQYTDSYDWSTMDWLNYQFLPGFSAGVGAGGGYVMMSLGSDLTYEQLQGRVSWRVTKKLSLTLSGGGDVRQFLDYDTPSLINPIYSASLNYAPFEVTSLSITASRAVSASYYSNQVTDDTNLSLNLHQRLLGRLSLDLGGGFRWANYIGPAGQLATNREDQYSFFSARLSTGFLKRGSVGAFYYYSDNASDQSGYAYSSNQVGLEVSYRWWGGGGTTGHGTKDFRGQGSGFRGQGTEVGHRTTDDGRQCSVWRSPLCAYRSALCAWTTDHGRQDGHRRRTSGFLSFNVQRSTSKMRGR